MRFPKERLRKWAVTVSIGVVFVGILSATCGSPAVAAESGKAKTDVLLNDLEQLLFQAAAVPTTDWKQLMQSDPATVKGAPESLPVVIMRMPVRRGTYGEKERKEFEFPLLDAGLIERAISRGGKDEAPSAASAIHPEFITKVICVVTDDTAEGVVVLDAKDAYRGRIHFIGKIANGRWRVTEFAFPVRGIRTVLQPTGKWHVVEGRQLLGLDGGR